MRNPLKRRAVSADPVPTLRARLACAKEKMRRIAAVNRALLAQAPAPLPEPVHRAALVNYATFLHLERERIQAELYPHKDRAARWFVHGMNEAWAFFHDGRDSIRPHPCFAPASTRAVRILDLLGIDWRADRDAGACQLEGGDHDTGTRPTLPLGSPAPDAGLVEAFDSLRRVDLAIHALHTEAPGLSRNCSDVPGWHDLEDARNDLLDTIAGEKAESLTGLQAKARALLLKSVRDDGGAMFDAVAASLASDLLWLDERALEPARDPIFAVIDETRRLAAENNRLALVAGDKPESHPAWPPSIAATYALWDHVNGVLLAAKPRTAEGCRALAGCVAELHREQGAPEDEALARVLVNVAHSPLTRRCLPKSPRHGEARPVVEAVPFRARPTRKQAGATVRLTPAQTRQAIGDAVQAHLDSVEHLLTILDRIDGDPEAEDGGDAEPELGAPEGHESQVVYFRGTGRDLETDTHPETRS